jgi:hypothetical protein
MCVLNDSDPRRVRTDVSTVVPDEVLDIRSPKIYCRSITKFSFGKYPERDKEATYLDDIASQQSSEYHIDRIDQNSIKTARLAVEVIAKYFCREGKFDFSQYDANEISDRRDRVYLLTLNRSTHWLGVGAVCFRWRKRTNAPHGLALAWVWINPFLRRKGILSTYWVGLRNLHGDFSIEPELSKAMTEFLAKRNECSRCGRECKCNKSDV